MDPAVWSPEKGDGVEYNIYVCHPDEPYKLYRVFHHYLDPKNDPDDRHWQDQVVDLSAYGGQTVALVCEALSLKPCPARPVTPTSIGAAGAGRCSWRMIWRC